MSTDARRPEPPLVSVIIPTLNRPQLLREAVASVLAQTEQRFEIVVVDDAGETPVELPADARIRVVRQEARGGLSAALNRGLDLAQGEYVTLLDDDDLYTPERLALGLEGASRAAIGLCFIGQVTDASDPARLVPGSERNENRTLEGDVRDVILQRQVPHCGQVTMRRTEFPRFEERIHRAEHIEWWIRAAEVGQVATIPRIGYAMRRHAGPRNTTTDPEARLAATRFMLEHHRAYFAAHPKAYAFQWRRIGTIGREHGDRRLARRGYARSFRYDPRPSTAWQWLRAWLPGS